MVLFQQVPRMMVIIRAEMLLLVTRLQISPEIKMATDQNGRTTSGPWQMVAVC
jgi:hypothetical protein